MAKRAKKIRADVKTKYGSYTCVFEPEPDMGGYTAEAPAVQGSVSWGKTLAEAKKKIAESIEGTIEARGIGEAQQQGLIRLTKRATRSALA